MDAYTLYNRVRENLEYQCRKHDLAPDAEQHATDKINEMTNNEFLEALSYAFADFDLVLKESV